MRSFYANWADHPVPALAGKLAAAEGKILAILIHSIKFTR